MKFDECKKLEELYNSNQIDEFKEFVLERLERITPYSAELIISAWSGVNAVGHPFFTQQLIRHLSKIEYKLTANANAKFRAIRSDMETHVNNHVQKMLLIQDSTNTGEHHD